MFNYIKKILTKVLLLLLALPVLMPFYMLIINSFKDKTEAAEMSISLPQKWNIIENYSEIAKVGNILTGYKNSFIITAISVLFIIIISALTSFVIQRRKEKISMFLYTFFVLGILLPSFTVPTILLVYKLHIAKFIGLIIINIATGLPMGIFLYVGYFKSIPKALDESAIIDGCGMLRLFFKIILPLAKPITATFSIVSILTLWNDFSTPLYLLSGSKNSTISLAMFNFFGAHSADWNLVFACVVAATLPVVIVYFLLQKYIVAGMVGGALKG